MLAQQDARGAGITVLASHPRFAAHAAPVLAALPPDWRGDVVAHPSALRGAGPILVADAARDLPDALDTGRPVVLMEHGVGQRYGGERLGGDGRRGEVDLYLAPGPYAADWWRERFPAVPVVEVGSFVGLGSRPCPRLGGRPRLALSFRFHLQDPPVPELRSAAAHYLPRLRELSEAFDLVGHGHPRALRWLARAYHAAGVPILASFAEVCEIVDCYAADNSSTLFEAAAAGVPVVALDAPWYRQDVEHGLRFWAGCPGVRAAGPEDLPARVAEALQSTQDAQGRRVAGLAAAYGLADGRGAERAATALLARFG